jgi:TetR/AcrR family tetracycline transcriptional repressor
MTAAFIDVSPVIPAMTYNRLHYFNAVRVIERCLIPNCQDCYAECVKVNRNMVTRAALTLLNEVGLERLTLRLLGSQLKVQAATLYWHFKSKEELLDEMATVVLADGAHHMLPRRRSGDWTLWAAAFGTGLRKTLLGYRDGARMVAGTRLTNTAYMRTVECIAAALIENRFTVRQTAILLSTIYNYTVSFVMEEQAVFPRPGQRSPEYIIAERNKRLDPKVFPILRQSGVILFDKFDHRYKEGLEMILRGAKPQTGHRSSKRVIPYVGTAITARRASAQR